MMTDKDYKAGDLVKLDTRDRIYPVLRVEGDGAVLIENRLNVKPERLSRPEFTVDMWVRPKTRYGTPGPKRIGKIADNRLIFDAMISRAPGREGEITEQPCGSTRVDNNCWFPVVDPVAPKKKKKEKVVSEDYRVGDLVHTRNQGSARYVVTDAGMGKPRAGMKLQEINGSRTRQNIGEEHICRVAIKRGDWVRHFGSGRHRKRVINVGCDSIHFDLRETDGRTFEPCFNSAHPKFWRPCATPETFETEDLELRAEVHELRIRLKEVLRENERWAPHGNGEFELRCARDVVNRLIAEKSALRHERNKVLTEQTKRLDMTVAALGEAERELVKAKSDIEFMRGLLKNTKKEATDALCAHKGALGQRDKEREAKWAAQQRVRDLEAEILGLRRQLGAPNTRIVM